MPTTEWTPRLGDAAAALRRAVADGLTRVAATPTAPEGLVSQLTSLSPVEAGAIGGGGVATLGAVRWLFKRRAGASDSGDATPTAVNTTAGGGGKSGVAFTIPGVVPVSKGIREVTHDEVHAIELGLVVGIIATWLYQAGYTEPVFGIVVSFIAGSIGYKRYGSKASKTIRMEPWYALLALAGGATIGWALFIRSPSLAQLLGL